MNTPTVIWAIVGLVLLVGLGYWAKSPTNSPTPVAQVSFLPSMSPTPIMSITPFKEPAHISIVTSKGTIEADLDGAAAPLAVGNFITLAQTGFYTGVTFHRVIPNFMIQAGDPLSKDPGQRALHGTGGAGYTLKTELNDRKFVRGSLGVARTQQLDTNGSQFFIVTGDSTSFLDGQYTNFGTVTAGMNVADAIVSVQRDANDNPLDPVTIQEVKVEYAQ